MKNSTLTPEESLLLISQTIEETKNRFKENGHLFILWGCLILAVIGSQHILELFGLHKVFDIAWTNVLYILGGIYTYFYVRKHIKKKNIPVTVIGNNIKHITWIIGMNLMFMGFLFSDELGDANGPVFIILFSIMILVSGLSIKFKPLIIGGVLVNLIGLVCFALHPMYYGYSIMLAALVGFIIPGILLNIENKKENV